MVSITDIQVAVTGDEMVYAVTVVTDVVIGTDEGGNPIYLVFAVAWNKNTSVNDLYNRFVALYQRWNADRTEEEQVRQYLLAQLP